jgi:hypothetical protein
VIIPTKQYEKPESGLIHGILADIVDLGPVTTSYNGQTKTQPMVRFIWILNVLGKDGKPLSVTQRYNISSFHEKSNIYKDLKMVLGQPPDVTRDIETYIGVVRKLWINREKSADGTKDYANIKGYLPADPGVVVPIPADFIRAKFRTQTTAGPQGQPAQTYAQPQQPQQPGQPNPAYNTQYQPPAYPPTQQGADIKF